jgi:hypothetical protein
VVYGLIAFTILKQGRVVLGIPYDLAALFLAYAAAGWLPRAPAGAAARAGSGVSAARSPAAES